MEEGALTGGAARSDSAVAEIAADVWDQMAGRRGGRAGLGAGRAGERLGRAGLGRGKGWAGLRFSFFWVFFLFPILFYS